MKHPELLCPAGNLEVLKTAVIYGADAVYIGGETMSLRAKADNFTPEEMREGIAFAHAHGAKVYVTANIFAHNRDLPEAERFFKELNEIRPDAVLVADPGMFALARRICPEIELHISTQANTTNKESCLFWKELGASRIVAARELSLMELTDLKKALPEGPEIEVFVHGAMCISYSGRCLLSNYLVGRDANRGLCTHPCRWKYAVVEETRPGEYMPIEENERGTFIFNSKDLNMLDHLPDLYASGVDSFKIEGRMKTALYVAVCARAYKMAMSALEESEEAYRALLPWLSEEIRSCTYRDFTTGFFYGRPGAEDQVYTDNTYKSGAVYLGTVEAVDDEGRACFTQKNKFSVGDRIEIMKPDGRNVEAEVLEIIGEKGESCPSAPHPKEPLKVRLSERAEEWDILRYKKRTGQ